MVDVPRLLIAGTGMEDNVQEGPCSLCNDEEDDDKDEMLRSLKDAADYDLKDGNIKDAIKELDKYLPQEKNGKTIPPERPSDPYRRGLFWMAKGNLVLDSLKDVVQARKCYEGAAKDLEEVRKSGVKLEYEYFVQHPIGMVKGNLAFLNYIDAVSEIDKLSSKDVKPADIEKHTKAARAHFEKAYETYAQAFKQLNHVPREFLKQEIADDPDEQKMLNGPIKAALTGYSSFLNDYATFLDGGDAKDKERAAVLRKEAKVAEDKAKKIEAPVFGIRHVSKPVLRVKK